MSDLFYSFLVTIGRPAFFFSSRAIVIGAEHTAAAGGYLLAANHSAVYDIPILFRHTRRHIDFAALSEIYRHPGVGPLCRAMNAIPLDRSRTDSRALSTIVHRLKAGRVVGFFPEGQLRRGPASVTQGGSIRPGIGRLAALANVPVIPAAIAGSEGFDHPAAWLPLRRVHYGVAFGPPLPPPAADPAAFERDLETRIAGLHAQLRQRLSSSQCQ